MLGTLFQGKGERHPLSEARALKQVLAGLPIDNAFKALDEINGWLESCVADTLSGAERFEIVRQMDEAARPHLKRLGRDYLTSPRLSRSEENRLWTLQQDCRRLLAQGYELCLTEAAAGKSGAEAYKTSLPLLVTRLIATLGAIVKWDHFRYGPIAGALWQRLGRAYLFAEAGGFAGKSIAAYPGPGGVTSPQAEYLGVLAFEASSPDCLRPLEIELAERLIAHLLPEFVFGAQSTPASVYWIDAAQASPPVRLARLPDTLSPSLRFFQPGAAETRLHALIHILERGGEVPPEIDLGGVYPAKVVLPVLRHLALCWAPVPPQRQHERHRVQHRAQVLPGLAHALVVFSPEFGGRPAGLPVESWAVENVSRSGIGACLKTEGADAPKIGTLLAVQPAGAENWLVGVVRRYQRDSENTAHVGIATLSRRAVSVELRPRAAEPKASAAETPALWLQDDNPAGEVRLVLPRHGFDARTSLTFAYHGRQVFLAPLALVEQGVDHEVARYRASVAAPA